jgi:RNA polymerase sigma factor (sigma-70 family)
MESPHSSEPEPSERNQPARGFESFFRSHYPGVVRIAHGVVGDTQMAEDVAQEVFIAAERRFSGSGRWEHAAAWVRVAAVHGGLNAVRGRRRREHRQRRAGLEAAPAGPEELVVERASGEEVRAALGRVPRRSATVLLLRHSGLSYTEVAETMGVRVGHVGTMLRRAEEALRKEMDRASRI